MNNIFELMINALPFIAVLLIVVFSCIRIKYSMDGIAFSRFFKKISWLPAFGFLLVGGIELMKGNSNAGTVWMILGMFNAVLNYGNGE